MHLSYVALHEVTWCMVVWCTQYARKGSSFMWHQLCQRCKYTISVDIEKGGTRNAIHSCRITCQRSASARERKIALYKGSNNKTTVYHRRWLPLSGFFILYFIFYIYIYSPYVFCTSMDYACRICYCLCVCVCVCVVRTELLLVGKQLLCQFRAVLLDVVCSAL